MQVCEAKNGTEMDETAASRSGKMLKRIQILEDGRVPAKEATHWKIEGQKRRISRKEHQRLLNKFEMEGFIAQKELCNLSKKKQSFARQRCPAHGRRTCRQRVQGNA